MILVGNCKCYGYSLVFSHSSRTFKRWSKFYKLFMTIFDICYSVFYLFYIIFIFYYLISMLWMCAHRIFNESYVPHGLKVVQAFSERGLRGLIELECRWRRHFLNSMQPSHLPPLWSIDHNHQKYLSKYREDLHITLNWVHIVHILPTGRRVCVVWDGPWWSWPRHECFSV